MFSGKKQFKGSCPFCENVIEYHILKFPVVNDLGEMICECNECNSQFSINCRNPDESYIVSGATKLDYLDYEVEGPSLLANILEKFEFKGDIFRDTPKYKTDAYPLYCCESCENNLEDLAHEKLESEFGAWCDKLSDYISIDIKGYGHLPEKTIIKVNFECECNKNHDAIFYRDFNHNSFDCSQFLLANISSTKKLNDRIDGALSKTDAMELLKKIIIRWELLFDKFFLIFPYAGHTRSTDENIIDLWESIISQTHSDKLTIVTKTQSLNSYKKAITNKIHDYSDLEKFGSTPNSIDSAIKHNKFHAKIYCGVSENHVESISGSANLATGPSIEQLNFRKYDSYHEFYDKYLKIFSSKEITENLFPLPKEEVEHDCHILLDQRNGYKYEKILKLDLAKNLFN